MTFRLAVSRRLTAYTGISHRMGKRIAQSTLLLGSENPARFADQRFSGFVFASSTNSTTGRWRGG